MSNGFTNDTHTFSFIEADRLRREADEAFHANDEQSAEDAVDQLYAFFDRAFHDVGSRRQRGIGSPRSRVG